MPDGIKLNADFSELYAAKKWLVAFVDKSVRKAIDLTTLQLQTHIKQDLILSWSGLAWHGLSGRLASRSGELKRSITAQPAEIDGDDIRGYVGIGTKYGKVHFGKSGQVYHMTPKNSQYLTIPLPGALDANGSARGRARDTAIFGKTFIRRSRAGNLIIFGKLNYVRGKKAGQSKGDILPLFLLRKSVDVPVTVTSESLRDWVQPILGKRMADIKDGLENSTVGA
jgi:hypothetical protein